MVVNDNYENTALEPTAAVKRVSWAAVLAGVVVVLAVQLALSLLGMGIGASTIDPLREINPVEGMGAGSAAWLAISTLLALSAGGWVSGRLSGMFRRFDGSLHGILTWSLSTIVAFYFLSSAVGGIVSGTAGVIGRGVSAVGQGLSTVAPKIADTVGNQLAARGIDLSSIQNEAKQLLQQTGKAELQPGNLENKAEQVARNAQGEATDAARDPANASADLTALVDRVFAQGRTTIEAADREALTNVLVARTNMSEAEASATIDRWQAAAVTAKAKLAEAGVKAEQATREAADTTAQGLAKAGIWGFVALLLGALAAAFGGYFGSMSNLKFTVANQNARASNRVIHT